MGPKGPSAATRSTTTTSTQANPNVATGTNDGGLNTAAGEDNFSMSVLTAELAKHQANMAILIQDSIKPLQDSVNALHSSVNAFQARLTSAEVRIGENFENLTAAENKIKVLEKQNESLYNRLEDLENRSRRSNLRVLNIPEKSEHGKDNIVFISELLRDVMGPDIFPTPPQLERAHRTGPATGARPRPFIVCFLRCQDREAVLRWSRRHQMKYGDNLLRVYADMSVALARKRAEFKPIKARLYEKGVQFRLLYPATLKIEYKGESHLFYSCKDATAFYEQQVAKG